MSVGGDVGEEGERLAQRAGLLGLVGVAARCAEAQGDESPSGELITEVAEREGRLAGGRGGEAGAGVRFVKGDDHGRERAGAGRDEEHRLLKIAGRELDPDDALFKILTRLGADDFEFRRGQEFRPRAEEGEPAGADRGAFERPVGGGRDALAGGADERRAARIRLLAGGGGRLKIRSEVGGESERGAFGHTRKGGDDRDDQRGVEASARRLHQGVMMATAATAPKAIAI